MVTQTTTPSTQPRVQPVIGDVVLTPQTAKVGESILVEVRSPDGTAYNNRESVPIAIDGVCGSSQYLVWRTPGEHRIVVTARRGTGKVEMKIVTVQIAPAAAGPSPPFLRVRWVPGAPGHAEFKVVRFQANEGRPTKGGKARPNRSVGAVVRVINLSQSAATVKPRPALSATPALIAARAVFKPVKTAVTKVSAAAVAKKLTVSAVAGPAQPLYTFAVSDGASYERMAARCTHDFGPSLDPNRAYDVFHVTVTVRDPTGPVTIKRSVSVANAYHMMKRRGVLQPPVTLADRRARFRRGAWRANLTVRNPEAAQMQLTAHRVEFLHENQAALATPARQDALSPVASKGAVISKPVVIQQPTGVLHVQQADTPPIVLAPRHETTIELAVPGKSVPQDAVGMIVQYTGTGPNNVPVRISAAFDIPENSSPQHRLSAAAEAELAKAIAGGLVSKKRSISAAEVNEAARGGALRALGAALSPGGLPHVMDAHVTPPNAVAGQACDPWNLPDVIPDGMFCMPTAETQSVLMPPRFMNASKGDIVIVPGDGSLISATLAAVSPAQHYSHSGIMTRNRDEITHSTASMERMTDSDYVGVGGFRPDILKYLWPGVITQTIDHAISGETFVDPESGKPYSVGEFGSQQAPQDDLDLTGASIAVAMVIKPDPLQETAAIRATLHGIADFAVAQAGHSHYRFFSYTDPTIGKTTTAPNEAKWAAGTFPSVCSALVWMAVGHSGITIEGGLEPADMDAGAQIAQGTPDGLYVYQADERLAAGEALYGRVTDLARQAAGQFWAAVTDIQSNLGNQVLNTFATDWSDYDATNSDRWRQTTDANAVSPQNLMFFDAPHYGYSEPLVFRDARVEQVTVYRWKLVPQTGAISGVVRYQGKPAAGADVQLTEAQATHTDGDGKFTLPTVPKGDNIIEAQKVVDGVRMSATQHVTVDANHTAHVTIDLSPPADVFRRVVIDGGVNTTDYEFAAAAYPRNHADFNSLVDLDPNTATHAVRMFDCVADDDTLGRLILTFDLQSDGAIRVKTTIRCYNSNKADTDDYDEGSLDPFTLPKGGHSHWSIYVDGENYAEAYFHVSNITDPS